MKRLLGRALALVTVGATIGVLAAPAHADDPGTITQYDSDYTVDAAGDVVVAETITVDFPDPRHGIYRVFDRQSIRPAPPLPKRASVRASRDGKAEPVAFESTAHGFAARIGDPDVTMTGTHVYRLSYTVAHAVNDGDEFDEFFWDTVGEDWQLRILSSRVTVHLPGRVTSGSCGVGWGETDECPGVGTDTLTFETGALDPGTAVSVRADYVVDDASVARGRLHVVLANLEAVLQSLLVGFARL
jgi:hypothetical protein